mmetsp:Transcript_9626/g.18125  ORF Transcript_9626/g.18125 Transcript_9626/m.18125 type:complete len:86 (-) Transcript_9626:205-462(-)
MFMLLLYPHLLAVRIQFASLFECAKKFGSLSTRLFARLHACQCTVVPKSVFSSAWLCLFGIGSMTTWCDQKMRWFLSSLRQVQFP